MPSISIRTTSLSWRKLGGWRPAPTPAGVPVSDDGADLERKGRRQVRDHVGTREDEVRRGRVLSQVVVDPGTHGKLARVPHLVGRRHPRSTRGMRIERLAHREGRSTPLPVPGAHVVDDGEAGHHLHGPIDRDVLASSADDHGQLAFVIDHVRHAWDHDRVARPGNGRALLVEPVLVFGGLTTHLRDVGTVIHADGQDGRWVRDRRAQSHRLDRVPHRGGRRCGVRSIEPGFAKREQLAHRRRQPDGRIAEVEHLGVEHEAGPDLVGILARGNREACEAHGADPT